MFLRNLMSMDTEEMLRAQPMDAVVLVGGCDKTVPAQLMAAASCDVPAISVVTGPMLSGTHGDQRIGACTDCRRLWGLYRAGAIDEDEINLISGRLMPTVGTCGVMGTASTIACMTEAMGMMLPGGASYPSVFGSRLRHAEAAGKRAVAMAAENLTVDRILTPEAFMNGFRVLQAIGGSTNGLIHMTALAGRLGYRVDLDAIDRLGRETPVLVDLKPTGEYYMDDFHKSGGMRQVLRELRGLLHLDCMTVTGRTLGEEIDNYPKPQPQPQKIIHRLDDPIEPEGSLAVLRGNLAPGGAIFKQSAAGSTFMTHEGRAVVFDSQDDMLARIDDPDLDVTAQDILVLKNAGPKGGPGMPECGYIPIPRKLSTQGVRDMVRISDARMSGTAFGSVVLHICPEAAVGGPLAFVESGDRIRLDVPNRRIDLLVSEDEMKRRAEGFVPRVEMPERGYRKLYIEQVQQADEGCDFDFLTRRPYVGDIPERTEG